MISFLATQLPWIARSFPLSFVRTFVICPVGHVQVPASSFPLLLLLLLFLLRIRVRPLPASPRLASPRLIALISSDSDYCCLRIVQLMCELRHCLKRRSSSSSSWIQRNWARGTSSRDLCHLGLAACQRQAAFAVSIYSRGGSPFSTQIWCHGRGLIPATPLPTPLLSHSLSPSLAGRIWLAV